MAAEVFIMEGMRGTVAAKLRQTNYSGWRPEETGQHCKREHERDNRTEPTLATARLASPGTRHRTVNKAFPLFSFYFPNRRQAVKAAETLETVLDIIRSERIIGSER